MEEKIMDIEKSIAEMKRLLNNQPGTQSSKYCNIIRESVEFSQGEILLQDDICEVDYGKSDVSQNVNDILLNDTLRNVRRKIDTKLYLK